MELRQQNTVLQEKLAMTQTELTTATTRIEELTV